MDKINLTKRNTVLKEIKLTEVMTLDRIEELSLVYDVELTKNTIILREKTEE